MRLLSPKTWPVAVWVLAPLAIGLLYAVVHGLLAPNPTLADLPPEDAILVQRFRNLSALDLASFGPRGPGIQSARDLIAAARNVRGLPGVDATGPVHMILMPRTGRPDSTMAVFRAEDAEKFQREFDRADFVDRDLVRHAQHLVQRGPWIAVAPNREDARRLGTGGITAADLGEDQALAAVVPRLVDHALSLARQYPWRSILQALGVQVDALYTRTDEDTGHAVPVLAGDDRLQRIRNTWAEARMWSWFEPGRVRIELTPQAGPVAEDLETAFAGNVRALDGRAASAPFAPTDAEVWVRAADHAAMGVVFRLLHECGVQLFPSARDAEKALAELRATHPEGVLAWGVPARGADAGLSIGVASLRTPTFLNHFLALPQEGQDSRPLAAGEAPLTVGSAREGPETPAGEVVLSTQPEELAIVAFGAGARGVVESMRAQVAAGLPPSPGPGSPSYVAPPFKVLATFGLKHERAERILGRAVQPGGFLAALGRGDVFGWLSTDGKVVRIEAWVTR